MDDTAYVRERARVEALISRWVHVAGLAQWILRFDWYREPLPRHDMAPEGGPAMDCAAQWEYCSAQIRVSLPKVARLDEQELEQYFLHELGHAFLAELVDARGPARKKAEERTATMFAKVLRWTREAGRDDVTANQGETGGQEEG